MPLEDVLSASGDSRETSRAAALSAATDPEIRHALEVSVH
jgi:hypothetical protein